MGKKSLKMDHIKEYQNFVNEQTGDPNKRFEILDAIKNTEPGKLLQRILGTTPEGSTGKYTDFDKMFHPVKTGRVYIKGSSGGSPRIYFNDGRWCQASDGVVPVTVRVLCLELVASGQAHAVHSRVLVALS